jgi:hypothetical protein
VLGGSLDDSIGKALTGGLCRIAGGAYVWEHGLLREHLVKGVAPEAAPALHAAAAEALRPLVDREDVQEERALHLRAAGRPREACEAMLEAGLWSLRRAAPTPRLARFEALAAWAREARLLDLEARGLAELAYAHAEVGEAKKAAEALGAAKILVLRGAGDAAAGWVSLRRSQAVRLEGRVEDGARATEEALGLARRAGEREVERLALIQMGIDRFRAHRHDEARALLDEAAARSRAAGDRAAEAAALRTLANVSEPAAALALAERAVELARDGGMLRVELVAKQVWVDMLWRTGAREAARREAAAVAEEAGRRALRQTASLLELQSAGWAALGDHWDEARAHRDAAARWGAATGAVVERMVLLALDASLALHAGDAAAGENALAALEAAGGTYQEDLFRQLLEHTAGVAAPAVAARLRRLARGAPDAV